MASPGPEWADRGERKKFLLRLDPALHAELETWAQQDLRSLNGQIEFLLRQLVARRRGQGDDGEFPAGTR